MQNADEIITAFGRVLRSKREALNLSQEKLAEFADLERTFISWLETGKKQATVVTVFKLCNALNIKPSEFFALVEKELL